jgi:hypothetical protein
VFAQQPQDHEQHHSPGTPAAIIGMPDIPSSPIIIRIIPIIGIPPAISKAGWRSSRPS